MALSPDFQAAPIAAELARQARRRVWRAGAAAQLVGLLLCLLFFHLILSMSPTELLELGSRVGLPLGLLALGWLLLHRRLLRPIRSLATLDGPGGGGDLKLLSRAHRTAQQLPYRGALGSFVLWALLVAVLGLVGSLQRGEPTVRWLGLMFGAFVISFGAIVYQLTSQRLALRPLLEAISIRLTCGEGERRPEQVRYPLRFKLILGFTALVFFACASALFITFVQSQELIDQLHGSSVHKRAVLLAELVGRDEERRGRVRPPAAPEAPGAAPLSAGAAPPGGHEAPLPLAPGEGLALVGPGGRVAARWGKLPEQRLLRQLVGSEEETALLTPRGLVGAVVPLRGDERLQLLLVVPRPPLASRNLRLLVFFMSLMFFGAVGLVHLSSEEITAPIRNLSQRALEMAAGQLDRPVPVGEADEIGTLSGAFETMRASLKDKLETIEELNATLEAKVLCRTRELEQALSQLQASESKLIQSEKMASLGQLVAGVAHEINNPVNFILNTLEPLQELAEDLLSAFDELRRCDPEAAQRAVARHGLEEAAVDIRRMLQVMRNGAERTRRIVSDLRNFSRLDEAELKEVRLEESIGSTLNLLRPSIPPGVQVETRLELDEPVLCYAGQLNQVFMNLLNNAVQAVGEQGQVKVSARREDGWAVVDVEDDGPGVPLEIRSRIFDPFFTTKEVGQGTGLGLSISLGIAARHGGELFCEDIADGGTRFVLRIPIDGPDQASPLSSEKS